MAFSEAPLEFDEQGRIVIERPINWNHMENPLDEQVWDKLTSQFWLPEKIPLSNDLPSWLNKMTGSEKDALMKIFATLTGLDSLQGSVGSIQMIRDARTQHEVAVLTNIAFMEHVHAKSYSSINATFISSEEIEKYWRWYTEDENVQYKMRRITEFYYGKNPIMRKAASVILESFLFYSGFYYPLYLSSQGKMTNTADIIKLIMRDESVHGLFLGAKMQQNLKELPVNEQEQIVDEIYELLQDLYENEVEFTEKVYSQIGLVEDVKQFLHYNANKALMNMGLEPLFSSDQENFSSAVRASLTLDSETHDFFSGSGSSYIVAKTEELTDDDWDF